MFLHATQACKSSTAMTGFFNQMSLKKIKNTKWFSKCVTLTTNDSKSR